MRSLLLYDTSIVSYIVYLGFSHFDLHYLYSSIRDHAFQSADAALCQGKKHPLNTIVIIKIRFLHDLLHCGRKNLILAGFIKVLYISVISRFAYSKDGTYGIYGPSVTIFVDEPKSFLCSCFFRPAGQKISVLVENLIGLLCFAEFNLRFTDFTVFSLTEGGKTRSAHPRLDKTISKSEA